LTPALLQRYALATVLHRHLLARHSLTPAQQTAIAAVLQAHHGQTERGRAHLETALAKGERYPGLVPPEEERRMEQRFARLTQLAEELDILRQVVEPFPIQDMQQQPAFDFAKRLITERIRPRLIRARHAVCDIVRQRIGVLCTLEHLQEPRLPDGWIIRHSLRRHLRLPVGKIRR
jgi:hypothetical protein